MDGRGANRVFQPSHNRGKRGLRVAKVFKVLGLGFLAAFVITLGWLTVAPPDLIRVATNYSAKIVCSNVFLAGRRADTVMEVDVQAPGHPILGFISTSVDRPSGEVRSRLLGLFALGRAVHRPGLGCANVPNGGDRPALTGLTVEDVPAPAPLETALAAALEPVLADKDLLGSGWRAVVVLQDGKIIGERYADGFTAQTPLLGWSMAKTVTGALVGVMEKDGLTTRETTGLFPAWKDDARAKVSVGDMLGMASSLEWNEGYGTVSDVTRMLYLENDMASFATKAGLQPATGEEIGDIFNYSSGTSVALSAYLQSLFPTAKDGIAYMQTRLLDPIGMESAIVETDATGTMVGGSYIYATARDWAKFGQFLLQGGRVNGDLLVPQDYVAWMTSPHKASQSGAYGQGHIWLLPPNRRHNETGTPFGHNAWWLAGHDGQSVGIVPDKNLVVVRMGLTPSKLKYRPAPLTSAIIEALEN